jgi:TatD DNase family protein
MIFDSHAHYDDEVFNDDREKLLASMKENGVERIVNVGASMSSSAESVSLAERYDFMYAAVGVHPSEVDGLTDEDMIKLERYSANEKVVAIGEIGLDYHYDDTDKELQKKWFAKQLDVAVKTKMPVIIHSRDAASDTMDILKKYQGKLSQAVIHCYSYSEEMAKEYVKMGYYIGIGGVLTFKNAKKLKEVAKIIPIEKIVLETDCPYLSPEPNRGQRNDSTNIKYVVKELAGIKGISEEEIERITYENAMKMYEI